MNFFRKPNQSSGSSSNNNAKESDLPSPSSSAQGNTFSFPNQSGSIVLTKSNQEMSASSSSEAGTSRPNRRPALWLGTSSNQSGAVERSLSPITSPNQVISPKKTNALIDGTSIVANENDFTSSTDSLSSESVSPSRKGDLSAAFLKKARNDEVEAHNVENEKSSADGVKPEVLVEQMQTEMENLANRIKGGPNLSKDELIPLQNSISDLRKIGEILKVKDGEIFLEKINNVLAAQETFKKALATENLSDLRFARDKAIELGMKNDIALRIIERASQAEDALKQDPKSLISPSSKLSFWASKSSASSTESEKGVIGKSSLSPSKKRASYYVPGNHSVTSNIKQYRTGFIVLSLILQKHKPNRLFKLNDALQRWRLITKIKGDIANYEKEKQEYLKQIQALSARLEGDSEKA